MIAERHYKNEDSIKAQIFDGHRRGVCDSDGKSIKVINAAGQRVFVAKSRFYPSSAVKVYVYRDGKMVLKG